MRITIVLFFGLFLIGCGRNDVDEYHAGVDARITVRYEHGAPENTYTYSTDTYWNEDWWYWCNGGIKYSFGKRDRVEEKEDGSLFNRRTRRIHYNDIVIESTFQFNPICSGS